jgi:hypothetical protein
MAGQVVQRIVFRDPAYAHNKELLIMNIGTRATVTKSTLHKGQKMYDEQTLLFYFRQSYGRLHYQAFLLREVCSLKLVDPKRL